MSEPPAADNGTLGAYGLVVRGLPDAAPFMQPLPADAPAFTVHVHPLREYRELEPPSLSTDAADLPLLGGGRLRATRSEPGAHYFLDNRPSDEDLLHPYLAPAAALFWQWAGREAIHAGVFATPRGAVLVLGDKEAGKSTTLGWLATEGGVTVLADDLAVMDGTQVLAGPRSIDLRPTEGVPTPPHHVVRDGGRHRIRLPAAPPSLPLAGVVTLAWGTTLEFTPVPFGDRLALIAQQRTFPGLTPGAVSMLELGSVPMIRASRPRDLDGLERFALALADYFA